MDFKQHSYNEWDVLKKVIVGVADYATIPPLDISLRTVNYANIVDTNNIPQGPYPQQVIAEANEDLEKFSNFLVSCGVEVVRPKRSLVSYYNYCPRDSVSIFGNNAIVAPMSLQSRNNEYLSFSEYLENIIEIPNYQGNDIYNENCIGNPNILALKEFHPKFDAANIIRANDDILYLVSNSGNKKGAEFLRNLGYNIHILEGVYSYMHIDSTVAFLREGLMLLNPSRIKDPSILPSPFDKWDYIMCPNPVDIGHYFGYCNASEWINMNLFSVNPNLVVVEKHQEPLRKELKKYNIECEMMDMRHQRTLGGGFHCVTLDLVRHEK
jgi:N-dimethylarginine dimethylaminohydrolase